MFGSVKLNNGSCPLFHLAKDFVNIRGDQKERIIDIISSNEDVKKHYGKSFKKEYDLLIQKYRYI